MHKLGSFFSVVVLVFLAACGASLCCSVWNSQCSGFSRFRAQALGRLGFSSCGSGTLEHDSCGTGLVALHVPYWASQVALVVRKLPASAEVVRTWV